MDYATKLAHWNEAVKSAEQNISLGQALKGKGMAILNSLEVEKGKLAKDVDHKEMAELVKQSTLAITQGAKLEADSRRERGKLLNSKPLEL